MKIGGAPPPVRSAPMADANARRPHDIARVEDAIGRRIHVLRGERVLLDADLAELYGVKTKHLNEAVRRNKARFPSDFMFQLSAEEARNLRSQFATSSSGGYGGRRYRPYAFTEQGVAMLSSILTSPRAIAVNVLIMRAFVQLRRTEGHHTELRHLVGELAQRVQGHDELLGQILSALEELAQPAPASSRPIGFRPPRHVSQNERGRGATLARGQSGAREGDQRWPAHARGPLQPHRATISC